MGHWKFTRKETSIQYEKWQGMSTPCWTAIGSPTVGNAPCPAWAREWKKCHVVAIRVAVGTGVIASTPEPESDTGCAPGHVFMMVLSRRLSSPTLYPKQYYPFLTHPRHVLRTSIDLKIFQWGNFHNLFRKSVPGLGHPHLQKVLPNYPTKPSLVTVYGHSLLVLSGHREQ